jgi:hypothetical protein
LKRSGEQGYKASNIVTIDGIEAVTFLEQKASQSQSQDPDAKYNALFGNVPFAAAGSGSEFARATYADLPDESTIKFANGTTYSYKNVAIVAKNLAGINTAAKLHEKFEIPAPAATATVSIAASATVSEAPTSTTDLPKPTPTTDHLPGYPYPVVKHIHDNVAGYFLNGTGYEDVAVLSITSFVPLNTEVEDAELELLEVKRVLKEFLAACKKTNKKKLVIDVSANGGGLIFSGYEIYSQLFPNDKKVWSGSRLRAHDALFAGGETAFEVLGLNSIDMILSTGLDGNGKQYPDFKSLYGPQLAGNQNATNILQYNFSSPAGEFSISAFDKVNPPQFADPVFSADNMVIVTDGVCASTCTIFTGLLVREQGVRTIALGGRPLELPMQAVGGVKGSQLTNWAELQQIFRTVASSAIATNKTALLERYFEILPSLDEPPMLPDIKGTGAVNFRNAHPRLDQDSFPTQFLYEAANCRLFYTAETVFNVTSAWTQVVDAAWGKGRCVKGSTVDVSGKIGEKTPEYDPRVFTVVPALDSPGSLIYKGAYQPRVVKSLARRATLEEMVTAGNGEMYKKGPAIGVAV